MFPFKGVINTIRRRRKDILLRQFGSFSAHDRRSHRKGTSSESYEYLDKLTKECTKVLLEEYNKTHKKFQIGTLPTETGANVVQWFERRDKNVKVSFDQSSVIKPQPMQVRMKFKGNTKDADFTLDATIGIFVIPGTDIADQAICFVKTLVISADKNNFAKRKF